MGATILSSVEIARQHRHALSHRERLTTVSAADGDTTPIEGSLSELTRLLSLAANESLDALCADAVRLEDTALAFRDQDETLAQELASAEGSIAASP